MVLRGLWREATDFRSFSGALPSERRTFGSCGFMVVIGACNPNYVFVSKYYRVMRLFVVVRLRNYVSDYYVILTIMLTINRRMIVRVIVRMT